MVAHEENGVTQYSIDELKAILKDGSAKVIDVRTEDEYQSGHIPGVPNLVMQDVANWVTDLSPEDSFVFVCRSGGRSQRVAELLSQNGFKHVANYVGGMLGWDGETKEGSEA